jgi:hypothetical protein
MISHVHLVHELEPGTIRPKGSSGVSILTIDGEMMMAAWISCPDIYEDDWILHQWIFVIACLMLDDGKSP